MAVPWLLVSIGILVLVLLVFFILFKKDQPVDYYTLYTMGIIFIPLGVPLNNYFMSIFGVILVAIGIQHRDAWKKEKKLTDSQHLIKLIVLGLVALLGVATLIFLLMR